MGRTYDENRAAIRRVEAEGPVPLKDLAPLAGAGVQQMVRWAVCGVLGCHLDAIKTRGGTWQSSRAAVARFVTEVAWRAAEEDERRGRAGVELADGAGFVPGGLAGEALAPVPAAPVPRPATPAAITPAQAAVLPRPDLEAIVVELSARVAAGGLVLAGL